MNTSFQNNAGGYLVVHVLIVASIAALLLAGLIGWAGSSVHVSRQSIYREQAIQIAEAGSEYYRWHLAHAPTDFQDGTGASGPYVHAFTDKDGNHVGQFSLAITAPPVGSTLVRIDSTGSIDAASSAARTIRTELAKPSIAKYAVVANDVMRFGVGTEVFGPIHSNKGVRFDGLAHNIITSATSSYDDPDHDDPGSEKLEFGVHTHVNPLDPLPPAAMPARPDVFEAGRQTGVPAADFAGITADLYTMRTNASSSGFYRAGSGGLGYEVTFQTNDTFQLKRVTSLTAAPNQCDDTGGDPDWGTWSVQNTAVIGTYAIPANGLIFLEDNVWVKGQINTARVTLIAATLPDNQATRKSITINNDLLYTNYDGSDVIGLIAQKNISVGLVSDNDLRIDAALIAQNGRVGRFYYETPKCNPNATRSVLTLWGMIATNKRYGFAYTDGTGYTTRNLYYDGNLLYSPPPNFPLTSDQYQQLIWEER